MTHLWDIDHDYYGPEGCYWANWEQQGPYNSAFDSWAEFVDEDGMYSALEGLNFLYRWDWKRTDPDDYKYELEENPDFELPGDRLELFWMMPRKGIMATSTITVVEADEPAIHEWLKKHADYMRDMWAPFDLSPVAP